MASISAVSICNVALAQLGANPIHSLQDAQTEAVLCSTFYPQARTYCLSRHPWNFAIKRIELPADADIPLFQFKRQYTLPADCLRILTVDGDSFYKAEGRKLLSHRESCFLKYVADTEDTSLWSQGFIDYLTAKLRAQLAYPVTRDAGQVTVAEQLLVLAFTAAKGVDASEDFADDFGQFDNSFVNVRV